MSVEVNSLRGLTIQDPESRNPDAEMLILHFLSALIQEQKRDEIQSQPLVQTQGDV